MTIDQLNAEFGISNQFTIVEGNGGFPVIDISNDQATAKISVYSGQVLSFQPKGEAKDLMFLSKAAYYKPGKAIKGGIPICWPWFGPDPEGKGRASHGFVRNRMWHLLSTEATTSGETKVQLGVSASDETKEIWPHSFELVIEIIIGAQLTVTLTTKNTGDKAFSITQAMHTYMTIGDVNKVSVTGLEGGAYLDKTDGGEAKVQEGAIAISSETDRIYTNVGPEIIVNDEALGRRIKITTSGSSTAIVWNPWTEISANMADLEDDAYQHFICVEAANAADDVIEIAAGSHYQLQATYAIERG